MSIDLSSFRCRRCGACCRIPGGLVRLREGESAALAAALGMDERTFLDEHTLLAPDRRSLVLRDHADGSCEMLGEDGLCRVHAAKPAQCREFPVSWRNPDSFRTCPGLRALARATAETAICEACPRRCRLADGQTGACRARRAEGGRVVCANYGKVTSLALDPIEKKPLAFFRPGSPVLSIGSFGCNLRCPFCQNHSISQAGADAVEWTETTPAALADLAARLAEERGNLGLAYTYNEPLVGWEFVRDCAREIRARGLANVLVSNGVASPAVVAELAPLLDAANIDLKGPDQAFYDWVGGDFAAACATIRALHEAGVHVEATTLVVPGRNDTDEAIDSIAGFLASVSPDLPLHVTRFFPRWRLLDAGPTPVATVRRLADVARRRLRRVLVGNC